MAERVGVLFVCTGNICRSPTAEGVFRALAESHGLLARVHVDSAGTHDYHVGEAPDERSIAHANKRGYDLRPLRARQIRRSDFDAFDRIVAMDRGHARHLLSMAPRDARARVELLLDHSLRWKGEDVPDPYYGGAAGFVTVLDMIEEACTRLLEDVMQPRPA